MWKGDFEGMKHHLQNWDTMLVGDSETKWLGFKTVLLDLFETSCPLARPKCPLAKPWLSRHIVAMQKQKKKLYETFLLTRSQEHWASYKNYDRLYTRSLRRSRAVYEQHVIASAIRNPKVLFRYIREGTKKETLSPG